MQLVRRDKKKKQSVKEDAILREQRRP